MSSIPVTALCDAKHLTAPRLSLVVGAVVVADDFAEIVYRPRAVELIDVTISPRLFDQLEQHALDDFLEASRRDACISAAYTDVTQKLGRVPFRRGGSVSEYDVGIIGTGKFIFF